MTATETLRKQVKKYIDRADENSLRRINAILEIDQSSNEWWKDKAFVKELDKRYEALESGVDKGITIAHLRSSLDKHKRKKNER